MAFERQTYIGMSVSKRVNLGNYESGECHLSINGITVDTTEAEMDALLEEQGALAFKKITAKLKDKIARIRKLP